MGVTYQMIADCLHPDEHVCDAISGHPQFDALAWGGERPREIDDERLLVVDDASSCLELLSSNMHSHCICICDALARPELASQLLKTGRCLAIDPREAPAGLDQPMLGAKLCALFQESAGLSARLQRLLLDGGSLTQILDVAAPYLNCPLVVSGVGLKIVAHTTRCLPQDSMVLKAIERGYFDEEQVRYFRDNGMPAVWSSIDDLYLVESVTEYRDYPIIFYIFRVHDNYYLHLTAHCNLRKPSAGLADQLRVLIAAIERYIVLNPPSKEVFGSGFPALMAQIAQGECTVTQQVRKQFRLVGVGEDTPYRLHLVDYGYDEQEQQLAMRAALGLLAGVPEALIAVVDSCAIVLEVDPAADSVCPVGLSTHAQSRGARLGVSDTFRGVEHLPQAYRQLKAVRQVGQITGKKPEGELSYTDAFADYFLLGEHRDARLLEDCLSNSIPARLLQQDEQTGGRDAQILEAYLECERRVSEASGRVFLHRNTLLYRVRRVEKTCGISFENKATRERMLIEFRYLRAKRNKTSGTKPCKTLSKS